MKKVSDLLKSESFRKGPLYELITSKFKTGTIPIDKNKFLSCFSYDEKKCALRFYCRLGDSLLSEVDIVFRTSNVYLKGNTYLYLIDDKDVDTFYLEYLKIVVNQLNCIDLVKRLISITGCDQIAKSYYDDYINKKYNEFYNVAEERILQLKNQEEKSL